MFNLQYHNSSTKSDAYNIIYTVQMQKKTVRRDC